MKKKVLYIIGIIFILFTLSLSLFIYFKNSKNTNSLNLNGTWLITQYGEQIDGNRILYFDDNKIKVGYLNESNFEYYSYNFDNSLLTISDLNKKYTINKISNNILFLTEDNTIETKITKISDSDIITKVEIINLVGKYKLNLVSGDIKNNEFLVFSENNLMDYRDNELYIDTPYSLNNNILIANEISKQFSVYINNDFLILVENDTGYIWELSKTND